jgi:Cu(I)/Ag(I) efflux system membrane fusion protein
MLPLDSMGGPVPVKLGDRTVFICCKGCEGKLKQDPDKYLAKLPQK